MNIVFGEEQRAEIADKHITLELDTLRLVKDGIPVEGAKDITIYGVIGPGDIPVMSLPGIDKMVELHEGLLRNYKLQNWDYCEQALDHLRGQWTVVVDEFYKQLSHRIVDLKIDTPKDWTPVLDKEESGIAS